MWTYLLEIIQCQGNEPIFLRLLGTCLSYYLGKWESRIDETKNSYLCGFQCGLYDTLEIDNCPLITAFSRPTVHQEWSWPSKGQLRENDTYNHSWFTKSKNNSMICQHVSEKWQIYNDNVVQLLTVSFFFLFRKIR